LKGVFNQDFNFENSIQIPKEYREKDFTPLSFMMATDYKTYLLEHYTILARPVFVIDQQIYIGNKPEIVAKALAALAHD
jgi:arsenate reductase-like glutaredoxin family protein